MKKLKNEKELVKKAIAEGMKYGEERGVVEFEATDSATEKIEYIYRLLVQKEKFEAIDFHLFSMMAEHAATALFSSGLYEKSERKRETYRGMMDLLLK